MRFSISNIATLSFLACLVLFALSYNSKCKKSWIFHLIFTLFSLSLTVTQATFAVAGVSITSAIMTGLCLFFTLRSYTNFKKLFKIAQSTRQFRQAKKKQKKETARREKLQAKKAKEAKLKN